MRGKAVLVVFVVSFLTFGGYLPLLAQWTTDDATRDEVNAIDLLLARPIGVIAGIVGTAVFVVTLPFTIPTDSVDKAADMFIRDPFRFSFVREFPEEE